MDHRFISNSPNRFLPPSRFVDSTLGFSVLSGPTVNALLQPAFAGISDERCTARLAGDRLEVESALRLRYDVFNVELGGREAAVGEARLEFDAYDLKCRHLIVVSRERAKRSAPIA